jgi:hypothetical protein
MKSPNLYLESLYKNLFEMSEISTMDFGGWFDEFNKKLFDNQLPKVPIILKALRMSTGYAQATRNKTTGKVTPTKIVISNYFKRDEDEMRGIFLHELIHLYFYNLGRFESDAQAHGKEFQDKIKELQPLVNFKIPLNDEVKQTELSDRFKGKRTDCILMKREGADYYSVACYSSGTLEKRMEELAKDAQGISDRNNIVVKMIDTDSPDVIRVPKNKISSNNIGTYRIPLEVGEKILATGRVIKEFKPRSFEDRFEKDDK